MGVGTAGRAMIPARDPALLSHERTTTDLVADAHPLPTETRLRPSAVATPHPGAVQSVVGVDDCHLVQTDDLRHGRAAHHGEDDVPGTVEVGVPVEVEADVD